MAVQKYVVLLDADHAVTAGERDDAVGRLVERCRRSRGAGRVDGEQSERIAVRVLPRPLLSCRLGSMTPLALMRGRFLVS